MEKKNIIYTRYSCELQNPKSCEDQERDARAGLRRKGIDDSNFVVLADHAETGTRDERPVFAQLLQMIREGKVGALTVDDQSRFSRGDNAYAMIKDLVYSRGRFISACEGVDTTEQGWELRVKVMELHNSTTIQELGNRVRRGQRGRIQRGLTAGDYPFGYESFYVNPDQAEAYRGVGPKPEKGVRINQQAADWVRKVFAWFIAGESIPGIARELTRLKVDKGHRGRTPIWHSNQIRRMLDNEKYVGFWSWGETKTIRNSEGKKKQVPVPLEEQTFVERPDLRIIDDETWEKAQARLKELDDIYGLKDGQKPRGPKAHHHHTEAYPSDLLGGLVFCGEKCGSRLWQHASGERKYLVCPNRGDVDGMCPMNTRVPKAKAEQAVLNCVSTVFKTRPGWVDKAVAAMREFIADAAHRLPTEIAAKQRQLADLQAEAKNLVRQLAKRESKTMNDYLAEVEESIKRLETEIQEGSQVLQCKTAMPDDAWIDEQLGNIPDLLRDDVRPAAMLLRKLVGRVWAHQVLPPGKQRGYAQLRFRFSGWEALKAVLPAGSLQTIAALLANGDEVAAGVSDEFVLDLGGPSKMDRWAPQIAEMRARNVPWKEIWEITGLGSGPAYLAWNRYVEPQRARPAAAGEDQPDAENGSAGATDAA
jgi:DNA invertase Pin-like site-specific DNA recombinase